MTAYSIYSKFHDDFKVKETQNWGAAREADYQLRLRDQFMGGGAQLPRMFLPCLIKNMFVHKHKSISFPLSLCHL